MKVAFILTMHQSKEIRPNGFYLVDRYLKSLKNSESHKMYRQSCQVAVDQFDRKRLALRMLDKIEKLLGDTT